MSRNGEGNNSYPRVAGGKAMAVNGFQPQEHPDRIPNALLAFIGAGHFVRPWKLEARLRVSSPQQSDAVWHECRAAPDQEPHPPRPRADCAPATDPPLKANAGAGRSQADPGLDRAL